jgi:hypothetical protein
MPKTAPVVMHKLKTKPSGNSVNVQEDHVGKATSSICYPRIQSCISMTGVGQAGIIGAHITISTEAELVEQMLDHFSRENLTAVYIAGGIECFKNSTKISWFNTRKKMTKKIRSKLNVQNVYFYDTWQKSNDINLGVELQNGDPSFSWIQGVMVDWNTAPDMSGYTALPRNLFVTRT